MTEPRSHHLSVDVDGSADRISGQVRDDDGPHLPFVGWLGLISALERAIAPDGAARPTASQEES
jgi:hypothetical protein